MRLGRNCVIPPVHCPGVLRLAGSILSPTQCSPDSSPSCNALCQLNVLHSKWIVRVLELKGDMDPVDQVPHFIDAEAMSRVFAS